MKDELYEEVSQYSDMYRHCTAEQILQIMGEMRDFFFSRMTEEDFKRYEKLRTELNAKYEE